MIEDFSQEIGTSLGEIIPNLKSRISYHSQSPLLDAQTLLAHITGRSRAWLLTHPEATITPEQHTVLTAALARLETGEPLPYILGHWEFYGLDFTITAETLIPRPETELLVEQALEWLQTHPYQRRAADVGTGSGCIAVSLAAQIPDLQVVASDISPATLEVARTNAQKHTAAERITFRHADLLPANLPPCHLICANLPYIPTQTLAQLDVLGKEPTLALDGGPDGLELIRRLLPQAARNLAPEGLLLLEIEATCGAVAQNLAREFFPEARIDLLPDWAGHDRLIRIET
jgi:release factor glutamine methyltransferase